MDKINDFPHKRQPNERNHNQHQPLDVNEKTPVNQIVMPYDQIKAYDMDTNLTLELKRENETAKDVNDIAFFILANSKDEYTNVENYSVENGIVNFTMPKVDTDKYYPQIMDKQGRVYSSNDNQFIDVVYNRESRVNELFPMIKHEVIEKVTPSVKQYVMDNKEEFSIKGDKGDKGEKGDRGERGKQGYKGNRGEKGDKGDRGEQGPQGEQGERGFRGNRGPEGPQGPIGPQGPKGVDGTVEFSELTQEQIEMIRGPQGPQGPEGPEGPEGPKGEKGDKGDKGDNGIDGVNITIDRSGQENLIPFTDFAFWNELGITELHDYNGYGKGEIDTQIHNDKFLKVTNTNTVDLPTCGLTTDYSHVPLKPETNYKLRFKTYTTSTLPLNYCYLLSSNGNKVLPKPVSLGMVEKFNISDTEYNVELYELDINVVDRYDNYRLLIGYQYPEIKEDDFEFYISDIVLVEGQEMSKTYFPSIRDLYKLIQ